MAAGTHVTELDRAIGRSVRARRNKLGLTMEQLAEKIGCTQQQVQKYETGSNRISCGRLVFIAEALDYAPARFFDDIGAR